MTSYELVVGMLAISAAAIEYALGSRFSMFFRITLQAFCFLVLSLVLLASVGSLLRPVLHGPPTFRIAEQALAAAWWILLGRVTVTSARIAITRGAPSRESRIVSDLLAGVIYIAAGLAAVSFVLDVPIRGLLATSGIIAIVLGLALQSTLGDLFSGIAVGVERPYRTGDMVSIDGGVVGRVLQVNWRSTHVQVGQDVAIVPNSVVAKSRLLNRSAPTPVSGESVEVKIHPEVPILRVLPVLQAALASCEHLAPGAPATVTCSALAGDGSAFELHYAAVSPAQLGAARTEVLSQVHRHLFHAGLPLGVTGQVPVPGWTMRLLSAQDLLARSDLFAGISEEHQAVLANWLTPVELQPDEVLFTTGDQPQALFMLASGTIEILVGDLSTPTRRHRLAPGETMGLVALVTGQAYQATARALNPVRAFRLGRDGLAGALAQAPALAEGFEEAVRRALAMRARMTAGDAAPENAQRVALLGRLRTFLRGLR